MGIDLQISTADLTTFNAAATYKTVQTGLNLEWRDHPADMVQAILYYDADNDRVSLGDGTSDLMRWIMGTPTIVAPAPVSILSDLKIGHDPDGIVEHSWQPYVSSRLQGLTDGAALPYDFGSVFWINDQIVFAEADGQDVRGWMDLTPRGIGVRLAGRDQRRLRPG